MGDNFAAPVRPRSNIPVVSAWVRPVEARLVRGKSRGRSQVLVHAPCRGCKETAMTCDGSYESGMLRGDVIVLCICQVSAFDHPGDLLTLLKRCGCGVFDPGGRKRKRLSFM